MFPRYQYAGAVKRHNVCKRHVAIDTGIKQTERAISPRYFNGTKIAIAFKCEETMPELSVNFGNYISQDSQKNQNPGTRL